MDDLSNIERRAGRIKLLLMDCDGVLTDGRLWIGASGEEEKAFHIRDGLGLGLWHRSGLRSGVISGRAARSLEQRAQELQINFLRQGVDNKLAAFEEILQESGVDVNATAFIGDDLNDLPVMQRVELSVAVADAAEETRAQAHYVTHARGGYGAVRETIELILKAQGRWSDVVKRFGVD